MTMRIGNDVACDIFYSCNKNPYVATLASGQSAAGFLEFMGSNAVQSGKVKVSFKFDNDDEKSMIDSMYPCNKEVNGTLEGYYVEPCTCNYCEPACKPNEGNAFPSFFDGFNVAVVAIVYAALIVLSVIIYFIKKKWQKPSEEDDEPSLVLEDKDDDTEEIYASPKNGARQNLLNEVDNSHNSSNSMGRINKSSVLASDKTK